MKIRCGFVSNSSSTSFRIFGECMTSLEKTMKILKNHGVDFDISKMGDDLVECLNDIPLEKRTIIEAELMETINDFMKNVEKRLHPMTTEEILKE